MCFAFTIATHPTGALHAAVSAASSTAYGPEVYSIDVGLDHEYQEVVFGGVARHYNYIVSENIHHSTFVGASMDDMAPIDDIPRLKDKNMLSVTIALTTDDVDTIIESLDEEEKEEDEDV